MITRTGAYISKTIDSMFAWDLKSHIMCRSLFHFSPSICFIRTFVHVVFTSWVRVLDAKLHRRRSHLSLRILERSLYRSMVCHGSLYFSAPRYITFPILGLFEPSFWLTSLILQPGGNDSQSRCHSTAQSPTGPLRLLDIRVSQLGDGQ
jgi:hypothetical protein